MELIVMLAAVAVAVLIVVPAFVHLCGVFYRELQRERRRAMRLKRAEAP